MRRPACSSSRTARRGGVIAAFTAVGMVLTLLASAPLAAAGETQQNGTTFVGTVEGTDAYIGIVVGKTAAFGYICDAEGVTHWLRGSVKKGDVTLTAATGASVVAELADGKLTGKAFLPADPAAANPADLAGVTVHDFEATRAKGRAGLFRQEKAVDGTTFAAGWVRLGDGSLRGEVTVTRVAEQATSSTTAPPVNTAPPSTTPPSNPGGVQANVGIAAVGQIAPADIQVQFPPTPTPRSRVITFTTPEHTRRCALARAELGAALNAWTSAGMPLSGPIYDRGKAALAAVNAACGATTP